MEICFLNGTIKVFVSQNLLTRWFYILKILCILVIIHTKVGRPQMTLYTHTVSL